MYAQKIFSVPMRHWSVFILRCIFLNSKHVISPFCYLKSAIMPAAEQKVSMKKQFISIQHF